MLSNEEKKQLLQSYGYLKNELQRLLDEKERWDALAALIALIPSEIGCKTKLCHWENTMDCAIAELVDCRRQLELSINSLSDRRQKEILRRRYIDGCSWKEIAQMMHLDNRWILRLHNHALENLQLESPERLYPSNVSH